MGLVLTDKNVLQGKVFLTKPSSTISIEGLDESTHYTLKLAGNNSCDFFDVYRTNSLSQVRIILSKELLKNTELKASLLIAGSANVISSTEVPIGIDRKSLNKEIILAKNQEYHDILEEIARLNDKITKPLYKVENCKLPPEPGAVLTVVDKKGTCAFSKLPLPTLETINNKRCIDSNNLSLYATDIKMSDNNSYTMHQEIENLKEIIKAQNKVINKLSKAIKKVLNDSAENQIKILTMEGN